jgi:hypothetical protein
MINENHFSLGLPLSIEIPFLETNARKINEYLARMKSLRISP